MKNFYFYKKNGARFLFFVFVSFFSLFAFNVFASVSNGTITPSSGYAWGPTLGWINFACTNCNVNITDSSLTGYAWSDQYGWINLSPTDGGVTNNCSGQLGGTAWSSHLGWINFSGATIDSSGKFEGLAGSPTDKSGNVNFACTNCNVQTDWRQCSLRSAPPPQVLVNSVTASTTPNVSANITITNEGASAYEYFYEWCVVSNAGDTCSASDSNIYYSSASKSITPGMANSYIADLSATAPNAGTYYFKLTASYGGSQSSASRQFTVTTPSVTSNSGNGGAPLSPENFQEVSKILINNGASTTNSNNVTLTFNADPGVKSMMLSENPNFTNATIRPYASSMQYTLSSGTGTKIIYAKFYDSNGQASQTFSASIVLTASPYVFTRTLGYGDNGNDVLELQKILVRQGFLRATPNGHYGPLTVSAVKEFQEKNNIRAVGYTGPATRKALNQLEQLYAGQAPSGLSNMQRQQLISQIQQKIKALETEIAKILAAQIAAPK